MKSIRARVLEDCKKFLGPIHPHSETNPFICLALGELRMHHIDSHDSWDPEDYHSYNHAISEVKQRIGDMAHVPITESHAPFEIQTLGEMLHYCCGIPWVRVDDNSPQMLDYRFRLIDALIEEYENEAA